MSSAMRVWLCALAIGIAGLAGCGEGDSITDSGRGPAGSLEIAIPLPATAVGVDSVVCVVTGTGMDPLRFAAVPGTDDVARAIVQNVPPGNGRVVRVDVYGGEGELTHEGSATVNVLSGEAAWVRIEVRAVGEELVFADPSLLAAVGAAVGTPAGELLPGDVARLDTLRAVGLGMESLEGIEQLTSLSVLVLEENRISDLSPLSGMSQLSHLALRHNRIVDLSPLVANDGIGAGDEVDLRDNPLSDEALAAQIPALQERGVVVRFEAPAILFADPNLEAVVRLAIGKEEGEITQEDVAGLDTLHAGGRGIAALDGIERLTQLTVVFLFDNRISDLSPLASLTRVRVLSLDVNRVSDVGPLASLTRLTALGLDANQVTDVSPLSSLTQLTLLYMNRNRISDVSALASLNQLFILSLDANRISDVTALVDNRGLGDGDEIFLRDNPLGDDALEVQIPALVERGVTVVY